MLFLSLKLASELYAVESLHVKEVLQFVKITRVPRTGPEVCGVVNLRGSIVTVFDLRSILGMAKTEATPLSNIVVLEYPDGGAMSVRAILVDGVQEVVELDQNQLNPPPATRRNGKKHLQHLAKHGDGFILILNVASLFGLEAVDPSVLTIPDDSMDIGSHEPSVEVAPLRYEAVDLKIVRADVDDHTSQSLDVVVASDGNPLGGVIATEVEVEKMMDRVVEQEGMDDAGAVGAADEMGVVALVDGDQTSHSDEGSPDEQTRMLVDGGLAAIAEVLENEETLLDTSSAVSETTVLEKVISPDTGQETRKSFAEDAERKKEFGKARSGKKGKKTKENS
ncbi:MAG: chemotaxis protein CheW [Nitrospirae bacterium]|nr:chemotaxis protein CheW [Magnetococcales bacterium]